MFVTEKDSVASKNWTQELSLDGALLSMLRSWVPFLDST